MNQINIETRMVFISGEMFAITFFTDDKYFHLHGPAPKGGGTMDLKFKGAAQSIEEAAFIIQDYPTIRTP